MKKQQESNKKCKNLKAGLSEKFYYVFSSFLNKLSLIFKFLSRSETGLYPSSRPSRFFAFVAIVFALFGTSCLRPHYTRPDLDIPASWREGADADTPEYSDAFWRQFRDPVLDELVAVALKNNHDLKKAIYRIQEYYDIFRITSSAFYPSLYATGSYSRIKSPLGINNTVSSLPTPPINGNASTEIQQGGGQAAATGTTVNGAALSPISNQYEGFLSSSWEIDLWGRIYSSSTASYNNLLAEVEAARSVVLTLITSVINSYFTLRQLDAELAVSKQTLASRQESLKLAIDRFELGETSEIEVRQAQAEVQSAAIRVVEFERDIPKQENLLSILLGENPGAIARGLSIDAFEYPMEIPAGIPSDLLCHRPDILQAEKQLISANARVAEAKSLFFPQISLTGTIGSISEALRDFASTPTNFWQYSVNALWPLFTGGQIYYNVKRTEAVFFEAVENYKQTILTAFREVNDALIDYEKERQLVVEHKIQVEVLKEYLKLAKLRYEEGEIDYLNVLDAERALFDAELQYVGAQADSFKAAVQIYKTLGVGILTEAI